MSLRGELGSVSAGDHHLHPVRPPYGGFLEALFEGRPFRGLFKKNRETGLKGAFKRLLLGSKVFVEKDMAALLGSQQPSGRLLASLGPFL